MALLPVFNWLIHHWAAEFHDGGPWQGMQDRSCDAMSMLGMCSHIISSTCEPLTEEALIAAALWL